MDQVVYKNIVVTYDGSHLSKSVFPHAASLAKAYNSHLYLLQVIPSFESVLAAFHSLGTYPIHDWGGIAQEVYKKNKTEAARQLEKIKADFITQGIDKISIVVRDGSAEQAILQVAEKKHCDLITIATHGRTGFKRAVLGSIAEYIIRHATCPVLVVRAKKEIWNER